MIDDTVLLLLAGFVTGLGVMGIIWAGYEANRTQEPLPDPTWEMRHGWIRPRYIARGAISVPPHLHPQLIDVQAMDPPVIEASSSVTIDPIRAPLLSAADIAAAVADIKEDEG